ncbi:Transcription initiation protein SPT3 [Cladophialophora chaetospira]|uniref:Transcription initiation protein SPT3 n=1 Tax=Cladophialophora chaetospira TaxID=386627 RepID=A0AA38XEK8_9EURO|nr:Transcription initiation protein SPT3 [Cladophialophora chaetospira]
MSTQGSHKLSDGRLMSYALSTTSHQTDIRPPVVLLSNSLSAPYRSWDRVTGVLLAEGFDVLRYDQPGHGDSSAPSDLDQTTFDSMAEDVCSLLQSLNITKLGAWIGVSMGAAKGVFFSTKYPGLVESLVICDTIISSPTVAGVTDVFGPRASQALAEGNMKSMVDATLARWFSAEWRTANPVEVESTRDIMMGTKVEGFVTCIRALQSPGFDLTPLAGNLGSSVDNVLMLVGELDANLPQTMDVLRRQIQEGFDVVGKNVTVHLRVVKNAGHVCYVDGFEEFCHIVIGFLKSVLTE